MDVFRGHREQVFSVISQKVASLGITLTNRVPTWINEYDGVIRGFEETPKELSLVGQSPSLLLGQSSSFEEIAQPIFECLLFGWNRNDFVNDVPDIRFPSAVCSFGTVSEDRLVLDRIAIKSC